MPVWFMATAWLPLACKFGTVETPPVGEETSMAKAVSGGLLEAFQLTVHDWLATVGGTTIVNEEIVG